MIALIENQLTNFLTHFTYLALILVLALAGMGVPIPEDIPLIFSGYLCSREYSPINDLQRAMAEEPSMIDRNGDGIPDSPNPRKHRVPRVPKIPLMILSGMIGVLLGDSIVFSIGRRGIDSNNIVARHLRKVLHSKRRERVERHFARHGNLTVFSGRFIPGFRSVIFAFAGMSKMSYPRFLIIDGIAAAISVPTFIILGWYFARPIQNGLGFIRRLEYTVLLPILVGIAIAVGTIYFIRRRRAAAAAAIEQV